MERNNRIVVAAEHVLFREGLRTLLEASRRFLVIHETSDGADALRRTWELKPDVLVLDVAVPRLPSGDVLREVVCRPSRTALVVLTATLDRSTIPAVIDLGARGLVLKDAGAAVLVRALRAVVAGECWVDRERVSDFVQALHRRGPLGSAAKPRGNWPSAKRRSSTT